jgi:dipeptidyl aminopeptidase/acylaminoacyl peptidase
MPDWSPDGRQIAFVGYRDGPADIYVANVDGSGVRNITNINGDFGDLAYQPRWSPDGSRFLFFRSTMTTPPDLCLMNSDGTGQTNLTSSPDWEVGGDFSPDGSQIVFTRQKTEPFEPMALYVMSADGSGAQKIEEVGFAEAPAWSPDGTMIAFNTGGPPSSNVGIGMVKTDGSGFVRISPISESDLMPVWQALNAALIPRLPRLPESSAGCVHVIPGQATPAGQTDPALPSGASGALPAGGGPPPSGNSTRLWACVLGGLSALLMGTAFLYVGRRPRDSSR